MKKIRIGAKDVFSLVDDDFFLPEKGSLTLHDFGYAVHKVCTNKKTASGKSYIRIKTYLHHLVMGKPEEGFEVDHINGNPLDNRKENLRFCTRMQNSHNTRNKAGRHKGVHYNKKNENLSTKKVWTAQITKDYRIHHIGSFTSENEAALAYNEKAKELYGEYARLNTFE